VAPAVEIETLCPGAYVGVVPHSKLAHTGCGIGGGNAPSDRPDLRAAVDRANITLRQAVPFALASTQGGAALSGSLVLTQDAAFDVGARDSRGMNEVRVSAQNGSVIRSGPVAEPSVPACPGGAISLDQALAVAEASAGGEAIAVVPDDDVACAREIQVLSGVALWEVKIGGDGAVLEQERSDEFTGKEN